MFRLSRLVAHAPVYTYNTLPSTSHIRRVNNELLKTISRYNSSNSNGKPRDILDDLLDTNEDNLVSFGKGHFKANESGDKSSILNDIESYANDKSSEVDQKIQQSEEIQQLSEKHVGANNDDDYSIDLLNSLKNISMIEEARLLAERKDSNDSFDKLAQDSFDFLKLSGKAKAGTGSKVNNNFNPIDKDDETIVNESDYSGKQVSSDNERKTFSNVFAKNLNQPSKSWDGKKAKSDIDEILRSTRNTQTKNFFQVSHNLKQEFFDKMEISLKPTFRYIDDELNSTEKLLKYFYGMIESWNMELKNNKDKENNIYLNHLFKNSLIDFTLDHEKYINSIYKESIQSPESPILNAFTMPLIFNKIIHNLSFNFYDGQLSLSLFNSLKNDLELYTIMVNQKTFNEVLKIIWIFNGKSNLYGIEMTFVEMLNNGFKGNQITLKILEKIILDYRDSEHGKTSDHSSSALLPIWSKEDSRRASNLEKHLKKLASHLRSANRRY